MFRLFNNSRKSFTKPEHIEVDVDRLELVPGPYKVYPLDLLKGRTPSLLYQGYGVCLSVDARDLCGCIMDGQILPKFEFKSFIRGNQWYLKVPLLDWEYRGQDIPNEQEEHVSRSPFVLSDHGFAKKLHIDAFHQRRGELITQFGCDFHTVPKYAVFSFKSSLHPDRLFDLNGDILAVNEDSTTDLSPLLLDNQQQERIAFTVADLQLPIVNLSAASNC